MEIGLGVACALLRLKDHYMFDVSLKNGKLTFVAFDGPQKRRSQVNVIKPEQAV